MSGKRDRIAYYVNRWGTCKSMMNKDASGGGALHKGSPDGADHRFIPLQTIFRFLIYFNTGNHLLILNINIC